MKEVINEYKSDRWSSIRSNEKGDGLTSISKTRASTEIGCPIEIVSSPHSVESPLTQFSDEFQREENHNRSNEQNEMKNKENNCLEEEKTQSTVGSADDLIHDKSHTSTVQRNRHDGSSVDKVKTMGTPPLSQRPTKLHEEPKQSPEKEEESRMKAILALKDVIFRQRKRIKKETKEKQRFQLKYLHCKMEKKQMQKRLLAQEKELERLRYKLECTKKGRSEGERQPKGKGATKEFPIQQIICQPSDEESC